jgi:hypothetical protein
LRCSRITLVTALVAALTLAGTSAGAKQALFGGLGGTKLSYDIFVEGSKAGTVEGEIRHTEEGRWQIEMDTQIEVEVIGGISIYSLDMQVSETYGEGRLLALDCTATENDTTYEMTGAAEDGHFSYTLNGEAGRAPAEIVPSTQLWRQAMMQRDTVLHAYEGRVLERGVEALGDKTLDRADGQIPVTGFRVYTDDDDARLWFDEAGLLVRGRIEQPLVTLTIERRAAKLPVGQE